MKFYMCQTPENEAVYICFVSSVLFSKKKMKKWNLKKCYNKCKDWNLKEKIWTRKMKRKEDKDMGIFVTL